jgi:tetratricopeptide (TPR) repeat protein
MSRATKRLAGALYAERRRAPRAPLSLRVVYVSAGLIVEARTVDISETGMCLHTHFALDVGTRLELRFAVDADAISTHRLDGDIVWVRPAESIDGDETYHNGLRFGELDADARRELTRLINTHAAASAAPHAGGDEIPELPASDVIAIDEADVIHEAVAADTARRNADAAHSYAALVAGRQALERGEVDAAAEHLERAVKLTPHSEDALEELGRVMYLKGNVVRAAALFDRALQLRQEKNG